MRWALVLATGCGFEPGQLAPDALNPDVAIDVIVPTWAVDATSLRGVPADTSEWQQLAEAYLLTSKPPAHVWQFQETTGPVEDSIGSASLAPLNAPTYRNSVTGWERAAVRTVDTDANQGFYSTAAGNLDGNSYLLLAYVAVVTAPTKERSLLGIGASNDHRYASITPAPLFQGTGVSVVPMAGTINPASTAHPVLLKVDFSTQTYAVYTEQEKISVAWTAPTGTGALVMIGNAIIGAADARYLYAALWQGVDAEQSDAEIKKLLQSLGWTVSGY